MEQRIRQTIVDEVARFGLPHIFREPLVAFSAADDPLFDEIRSIVGAHHLHPRDIMPEAQSVISFFIPFTRSVIEGNRAGDRPSQAWAESYDLGNRLIGQVCRALQEHLEGLGVRAQLPVATFDREHIHATWSQRSVAFVAGLGRFGLNRMLLTPVGGAGRYGSLLTEATLTPGDRPTEERCAYFKNGTCMACVQRCPVRALAADAKNSFDRQACFARCMENDALHPEFEECEMCGKCVVAGPCAIIAP